MEKRLMEIQGRIETTAQLKSDRILGRVLENWEFSKDHQLVVVQKKLRKSKLITIIKFLKMYTDLERKYKVLWLD